MSQFKPYVQILACSLSKIHLTPSVNFETNITARKLTRLWFDQ